MSALLALFLTLVPAPAARAQAAAEPARTPSLIDDLDRASLALAARQSLSYYDGEASTRTFPMAGRLLSPKRLRESAALLALIFETSQDGAEIERRVREGFELVTATENARMLFTGYYEPVVKASLTKTELYPYPLYARPTELLEVELEAFNTDFRGGKLWGRPEGGRLVPYLSREDIDYKGALEGRGLELAWVPTRWDALNVQIQGSARLDLGGSNGKKVLFAGSNGLPFKSPARVLLETGRLTPQTMSNQSARAYVESHPQEEREILSGDPRYTFFRLADAAGDEGPLGTIRRPLTGQRSLAVDPRIFPLGAPVWYSVDLPAPKGGLRKAMRFAFLQDTGGAILGPARADVYMGSGDAALALAGALKTEGQLYVLLKKE